MHSNNNSFQTYEPCDQNNFFNLSLELFDKYIKIIESDHYQHLLDGINYDCDCNKKIQEFIAVTNNLRDSYARNTKNKMD